MNDFQLSEICKVITDGDHAAPPKADEGVPFITIRNFDGYNSIDFTNCMFVPQDYYDNLKSSRKARQNDIIYSVVGSFGIPILIKDDKPFVFQRHIALLRPDTKKVNPTYLFHLMRSSSFYAVADILAVGSAQRTITLTALRRTKISLPSLSVQNSIGKILADYDNLIAVNRRRIAILEEMAMRTYQEWFVHFRFPGHETTEFVGGLPIGWSIGKLDDIAHETGKSVKKQNRNKYAYYLPIDCMPRKSLSYTTVDSIENAESSLISFSKGDILFGAMRPYYHKVVFARDKGLTRSTSFVLNAKDEAMWGYLLMLLFDERTIDFATQICTGSTMPYVLWDTLKKMNAIIPSKEIAILYLQFLNPIVAELEELTCQNSQLQQMRDRLLPQLMSGQIEVTP